MMHLESGKSLGAYEIVSPLGAGGMGEVYLARDTKLGREVAIKVLPESVARDPERLARFEREARVLASLNHAHVGAIYGFEEAAGIRFLVLEYVDGATLSARLRGGRLTVEDALAVCRQIAEALEAAHDGGVVHRDLKPANVMVRVDGTVKVLDFGLAKALAEGTSGTLIGDSPTLTADHTAPGVVLGTAPYMSPEQARGKPADKRTDIWALGCVLFECLTGRRAFDGATTTDVLASVIQSEPDYDSLPGNLPVFVEPLLRRCLDKDSKRRLRDAGEVRVAIEGSAGSGISGSAAAESSSAVALGKRGFVPWILVAVLAAILVIALGSRRTLSPDGDAGVSRWSIALPPNTRVGWRGTASNWSKVGDSRLVAVSEDGERIVYAVQDTNLATVRLFLKRSDALSAEPLAGTENARGPFFSPDGKWLGFLWDGVLRKMLVTGGAPQEICPVASTNFYASWSPDGASIVFATDTGLWRVSADGGEAEQLTEPDHEIGEAGHYFPRYLPDGNGVLFTVSATRELHIAHLSFATKERSIIIRNAADGHVLPSGHLVFARSGELLAVPFDAEVLEVKGSAIPVVDGVHTTPGMSGVVVTQFDVSQSGALVFVPKVEEERNDGLVWVDRAGEETNITAGPGVWMHPRLSPDEKRISLDIQSADGMRDVYVYEAGLGQLNRVTRDGTSFDADWRPDGNRIAFSSGRMGGRNLYWMRSDFSGEELILNAQNQQHSAEWSADGRELFYFDHVEGGIWSLDVEGDRVPKKLLCSADNERWPRISPDGRWMAYVADESGRAEVFVQSYPDLETRRKVSVNGGGEPVWSHDGKELFFRKGSQVQVVEVETDGLFRAGAPTVLFSGEYDFAPIGHQHYDISNDDERFLMVRHGRPTGPSQVNVVLNWFEELKAKALVERAE